MQAEKYYVSGLLIVLLAISGLFVTAGIGGRQSYPKWEYANYYTSAIPGAARVYKWGTPYEYVAETYDFNDRDSELRFWQRVGFKFGNKDMFASDWLNFLGQQGWELVNVTRNTNGDTVSYWFKRPGQQ